MRTLLRWWRGRQFEAALADQWGFTGGPRKGEDFGARLSRETARWVEGK